MFFSTWISVVSLLKVFSFIFIGSWFSQGSAWSFEAYFQVFLGKVTAVTNWWSLKSKRLATAGLKYPFFQVYFCLTPRCGPSGVYQLAGWLELECWCFASASYCSVCRFLVLFVSLVNCVMCPACIVLYLAKDSKGPCECLYSPFSAYFLFLR